MTLVGMTLNLEEKMKIYPQVMTSLTKRKHACAGRAKLLFLSAKCANFDLFSEIYGHPVMAATRAHRFADHVTKRNGGLRERE